MPRMPKGVAALAAITGVLTIITAILFATMPDPFVRQFGWFLVVLATMGSVALVATGAWQRSAIDRRIASITLAVLALGDVGCNLAAFRLNTFGRVPIPTALHVVTTFVALLVATLAVVNATTARRAGTGRRPMVALGAALVLGGAIVGAVFVIDDLGQRALQPLGTADAECGLAPLVFGRPARDVCITREQAKPISTSAFFTGLGGLGVMALGAGMILARGTPRLGRIAFGALLLPLAVAGLTVAARVGARDLDTLYIVESSAERSCAAAQVPAEAKVISPEEQAYRECIVAAHGTNPWHASFWAALGVALPAMVASGMALAGGSVRREENALDSA